MHCKTFLGEFALVDRRTQVTRACTERGKTIHVAPQWGNPFVLAKQDWRDAAKRDEVIRRYREWVVRQPHLVERARRELRGKNLACWCAPLPCHADVLLEIANE